MKPIFALFAVAGVLCGQHPQLEFLNRNKPLRDAHNCYPYEGRYADRIDRALAGGFPVAIEQDVAWAKGRPVVSHTAKTTGDEATLREYFFERVRPLMEKALRENKRETWPLITLHFDFKDLRPELLRAVWGLLGEYEGWITTAAQTENARDLAPFTAGPLLVLTEDADIQEKIFFGELPKGARLRVFGSAHTGAPPAGQTQAERIHWAATAAPGELLAEYPTNYRRWWNNSWYEVEEGGQSRAGDWTAADEARLRALVDHAHKRGFWIRFYTLDGFAAGEDKGWGNAYNFGSREAVQLRWRAAARAGVDLIAADQYEEFAAYLSKVMTASAENLR